MKPFFKSGRFRSFVATGVFLVSLSMAGSTTACSAELPLSPAALAISADGQTLFVAAATGGELLRVSLGKGETQSCPLSGGVPSGLALSSDGKEIFVSLAAPESQVAVVDSEKLEVLRTFPAGHTALAPVLSRDGKVVYVCNRFNNEVAFLASDSGHLLHTVSVSREPVAQALTPDGRFLVVANHIHSGRADLDVVASAVSVIDAAEARLLKNIDLPSGSGLLRGVTISPDGKYAAVTHVLARFHLPTTQVERGWINTSALTLIDLPGLRRLNTVLLDNIDRGAANPWDTKWTSDGRSLLVTHAGTHEVSVIDAPGLLSKLSHLPDEPPERVDYDVASHVSADVPNDLSFLVGLRRRVRLNPGDSGPRSLVLAGSRVIVGNYFSDSISTFDFTQSQSKVESLLLPKCAPLSSARLGELYFNDATLCFQGWQSCASCHSSDARVDGLNWDNLNDGIGNPKNAKSLLQAHLTSPSMWLGVREDAEGAVRAGLKYILFTVQPESVSGAIEDYLKSLAPEPSPHLVKGKFSLAAQRGAELFATEAVGCAGCHSGPLFTDQKTHDVGTRGRYDKSTDRFDTPSLVECWRSAPYLHDGSATTILEVLTSANRDDRHGNTHQLSPDQLNDLAAYVLSL